MNRRMDGNIVEIQGGGARNPEAFVETGHPGRIVVDLAPGQRVVISEMALREAVAALDEAREAARR